MKMVRTHKVRKLLMSTSSGGTATGDGSVVNPLHSTSKYKAYVQAVDRALKTFENPNEWADLISALGKLAKVFQSNAKFGDVPKPVLVAKRLSQCLHPALPMGVHLKALETYRQIFDILGPKLPKSLYLFAVGLFPLMDHCGIKVKSELFNLFEQYLVPLGVNLKPALPGFLAGVLLGLEEGTEFYNRSLKVLDNVCIGVGESSFFACLWQATLGSPSVRLPAMLYVNAKFDKTRTLDDQISIVGEHVNHMIAALCATADDMGSPLIQRHLLDFLSSAFPLDTTYLTRGDLIQLLQRCLFVVLRRDMSLNRRLYTWLMNPTGGSVPISGLPVGDDRVDSSFFHDTVLPLAVDALDSYLQLDIVDIPYVALNNWAHGWGDKKDADHHYYVEVRVCRLLTYLQDRADIGRPLLNRVFPLLLTKCCEVYPPDDTSSRLINELLIDTGAKYRSPAKLSLNLSSSSLRNKAEETDNVNKEKRIDEMSKTLNNLLGSLEAGFLWDFLGGWFDLLVSKETIVAKELTNFSKVLLMCLQVCNLDSEGSIRKQSLPILLKHIIQSLTINMNMIPRNSLIHIFIVCRKLVETVAVTSLDISTCASNEDDSQTPASPSKVPSPPIEKQSVDPDQLLMEECLVSALSLLGEFCKFYYQNRSQELLPVLKAVFELVHIFVDYPLFCFELDSSHSAGIPPWLSMLLETLAVESWHVEMKNCSCIDVEARIECLKLLCSIYVKSTSVLAQHQAATQRLLGCTENASASSATTVLLRPFLLQSDFEFLEKNRVLELCGLSSWYGLSSHEFLIHHSTLARILCILHSRKPNEASSDVENIVVAALTNSDQMISTEAAITFSKIWVLSRHSDSITVVTMKPFNRAVMVLLSALADESVSQIKPELKSLAAAWFIDCSKHNDLSRIVQMLATMLMNPVTARISIQYLWKESKIDHEQLSLLPPNVSAVTLATSDGKQRVYHVEGSLLASSWHSELCNRLLLNSQENKSEDDLAPAAICPANSADVPHFDDDNDSLDTLSISMEGIEPAVVETLQFLIDSIVDEEESEIEAQRNLKQALEDVPPTGQSVVFRAGDSDSTTDVAEERIESELKDMGSDSLTRIRKEHRRTDSLQESIFSMTDKELKAFDTTDLLRPSLETVSESGNLFHELHVYMLLYGESGKVVDLGRAETTFRILSALLNPRSAPVSNRMLLSCLVSSGTASQSGDAVGNTCGSLVELMSKHVRAILGQHFWSNGTDDESAKHRHLTLLELLITISLHYLRSFFLNSPISPVSETELVISWKCKVAALDFLSELFSELSSMIAEQQSRSFVIFVQSILTRAKLQKCLLHLLLSAVRDPRATIEQDQSLPLSVSISEFNEGGFGTNIRRRLSGLLSAYHRSLLSFTAQSIRLESEIKSGFNSFGDQNVSGISLNRLSMSLQLYNNSAFRGTVREPGSSLVELRAFLLVVLNALKRRPERHDMWLQFLIQILPWMERSLSTIVVRVVEQLCKNVELAMACCYDSMPSPMSPEKPTEPVEYPANFLSMSLEAITTLVHYCVVDTCPTASSTIHTGTSANQVASAGSNSMVGQAMSAGTKGATELLSNLVKAFSFSESNSTSGVAIPGAVRNGVTMWIQAKNDMLTFLPHSLATICDVWTAVRDGEQPKLPLGTTTQLRRLVLDLLSPIAQHHQQAFLQALSLVWLTRSAGSSAFKKCDPDQPSFVYSPQQLDIANLLLSLKVIPLEILMQSVCETLKEVGVKVSKLGPNMDKATFPTEAPLLELVHGCVRAQSPVQLRQCWPALQSIFSEAPLSSLPPRAVFLLFIILCDYVRIAGATYIVEDKLMSKAVQDAVQRLTDAVNTIVGWQLEATTWLKRTLVVRHDQGSRSQDASPSVEPSTPIASTLPSLNTSEQNSVKGSTLSLISRPASIESGSTITSTSGLTEKKSSSNLRGSLKDPNNNKRDPAHSTQALFLLAENLAELVDSVCKSDDKDKLIPTLQAVWNNVVPYLKAKNARNARFFLASSQLLASMSSFNYMRPVWKKITLELLLDTSFFKMDVNSIRQWLIVSDHLMTHDKTSFKDLLKNIVYTANASFSIMTSKEQEYEARSQAVKRLAFVVLGSELDQYQAQMNDIQERLSENLRVSQSPAIRSAVFLCIRVLLIRLGPPSLVGIWPIMVTELVHVLLQMEQHLSGDSNSDDSGSRDDSWMQLYLAACKLLETLCTLPAGYLAQFQMCQWAFVSSVTSSKGDVFGPFAGRINRLLNNKFGKLTDSEKSSLNPSLNSLKILTGFEELRPFFYALARQSQTLPGTAHDNVGLNTSFLCGKLSLKNAIARLENALYVDFAEHWQL